MNEQQNNESINCGDMSNLSLNTTAPLFMPKHGSICIDDIRDEQPTFYQSSVFGIDIPDFIVKELAIANEGVNINKVLFVLSVFCERASVLCNESINYYNLLTDNLLANNDIVLSSIHNYDDIRCKYILKYNKNNRSYKINCIAEHNVSPVVNGRLYANPMIRMQNCNGDIIDYIIVPFDILTNMINVAIRNYAFPGTNKTCLTFIEPEVVHGEYNKSEIDDDRPLKYLPILWERGITIEFYGNWLLAVTCRKYGEDLLIRSIDDFFNKHFGMLDDDYTLEGFVRELEYTSIAFIEDVNILYYFYDSDLENIAHIISNISDREKLSVRKDLSTNLKYVYTNNDIVYDSIYEVVDYINSEYGTNNIMHPEYITAMCIIFDSIGVDSFLKKIENDSESNKPSNYLPILCAKGINIQFYGSWLLGFTNPTNGDEVVIYSIDDFFNEEFGELDGDYSLRKFVDELQDSSIPFMSDEYIVYNFDRIDLNNIGDIISHINGLGMEIVADIVVNKNDYEYRIVYNINGNEYDIYETIDYISTEHGFSKDDIHPEYIPAMYVIFYYIGVDKFLTKIGYKRKTSKKKKTK